MFNSHKSHLFEYMHNIKDNLLSKDLINMSDMFFQKNRSDLLTK